MSEILYEQYKNESDLLLMIPLIEKDLSEPYSIYTYRYFVHQFPELSFLAFFKNECVGAIICKIDKHKEGKRGYIGMLAVSTEQRQKGIGSRLVKMAIDEFHRQGIQQIVLDTETTNVSALKLYEKLGFIRDKRLAQYYLNGVDAFRLKLNS